MGAGCDLEALPFLSEAKFPKADPRVLCVGGLSVEKERVNQDESWISNRQRMLMILPIPETTRTFFHCGCSTHVGRIHSEYPCPEMNILAFSNIPIEVSYIYPVTSIIEVFQSWIVTHSISNSCLNMFELILRMFPENIQDMFGLDDKNPMRVPSNFNEMYLGFAWAWCRRPGYRLQFNLKSKGLRQYRSI